MRDHTKGFSSSYGGRSNSVSPLLLGSLALFLICFGGVGIFFYLMAKPPVQIVPVEPSSNEFDLVDTLVAVDRIEAGVALEPVQFRKESRPAIALGPNRIKDFEQIKGAYTSSFISAGQPLLADYITFKRPINQIQANIPDGYRAVTMAVDETTSVEGWARAGAKVDVVLISLVNGRSTATVVVQNARVLSGGGSDSDNPDEKKRNQGTVTLMVTVEESAKIQLASSSGVLSLNLRGDEDTIESSNSSSISIDAIITGDQSAKVTDIPSEGSIKIDGREFLIVNGKLVPREKEQR